MYRSAALRYSNRWDSAADEVKSRMLKDHAVFADWCATDSSQLIIRHDRVAWHSTEARAKVTIPTIRD